MSPLRRSVRRAIEGALIGFVSGAVFLLILRALVTNLPPEMDYLPPGSAVMAVLKIALDDLLSWSVERAERLVPRSGGAAVKVNCDDPAMREQPSPTMALAWISEPASGRVLTRAIEYRQKPSIG